MAKLLQVAPLFGVRLATNRFIVEAVPQTEQLDYIFSRLFEDYQAIYAPCVKPEAIASVEDELGEEFEDADDHLVVVMECIQCTFNYRAQVLRIEPVEEVFKIFTSDKTS